MSKHSMKMAISTNFICGGCDLPQCRPSCPITWKNRKKPAFRRWLTVSSLTMRENAMFPRGITRKAVPFLLSNVSVLLPLHQETQVSRITRNHSMNHQICVDLQLLLNEGALHAVFMGNFSERLGGLPVLCYCHRVFMKFKFCTTLI